MGDPNSKININKTTYKQQISRNGKLLQEFTKQGSPHNNHTRQTRTQRNMYKRKQKQPKWKINNWLLNSQ